MLLSLLLFLLLSLFLLLLLCQHKIKLCWKILWKSNHIFWTSPISAIIPVSFKLWHNYLQIAPKEPTNNGTIFILTFQIFCNSLLRSWYFSISSFSFSSMLLSPGAVKSMTLQVLLFLSTTMKSCLQPSIRRSVWILKSQKIL